MKYIIFFLIFIFIVLAAGGLFLLLTCQAIQIIKTHQGVMSFQLITQRGDAYEPTNCGMFPLVVGQE